MLRTSRVDVKVPYNQHIPHHQFLWHIVTSTQYEPAGMSTSWTRGESACSSAAARNGHRVSCSDAITSTRHVICAPEALGL